MACFALNGQPPNPSRTWSRVQGICTDAPTDFSEFIYIPESDSYITALQQNEMIAMLNKGNVLQYKKNSSNITKQQRYSLIAQGRWINRTTSWASQSVTTTIPNTQHLQRVNYRTIFLDTGAPANLPITCPAPVVVRIPSALPTNPNSANRVRIPRLQQGVNTPPCPVYVTPSGPPIFTPSGPSIQLPEKPVDPIIVPVLPVINPPPQPTTAPIVIPDGGNLICNTRENICTGEVFSSPPSDNCNPTSASDVPGPIMFLCYNDALPTYYPRQRRTFGISGNIWPTQAELLSILNPSINTTNTTTPNTNTTTQLSDTNLTNALAKLYQNVGDDLETIFTYFSIGNLGILKETLTYDVYQNLATLLLDSSYPVDINYTNVLGVIQISLDGLYKSVIIASAQQTEIARLNDLLLNMSSSSFKDIDTLSVASDLNTLAVIRPEIKLYIQLYGYPANGIFDAELINRIKADLGIA